MRATFFITQFKLRYVLLLCLFFIVRSSFADIPPDVQKIISSGKIVIALNAQDYPPYFYTTANRDLDGFDIALAKGIAKNLGVKLEFNRSAKSFNDVIKEVDRGNADIGMGGLSASLERGLSISFSNPYLLLRKVLVVNRLLDIKLENNDRENIRKDQIKFAVPKGSSYERSLQERDISVSKYMTSQNMIVSYDSIDAAFKDVLTGKIYAFYIDEGYVNYLFEKNKSAHIYVKKDILTKQFDPIAIAVSWKNQTLLNWINLYIQSMKYDGSEDVLIRKYLKGI